MKKEIAFIVLCLAGLAFLFIKTLSEGGIAFNSATGHPQHAQKAPSPQSLLASDVKKIELHRADEIVVFVRQPNGLFKMTNPKEAKADRDKIHAMLELLMNKDNAQKLRLPFGKDLPAQKAAMQAFGMSKPQLGVVFEGDFGSFTLWVGDEAPQEEGHYMRWTTDMAIELMDPGVYKIVTASVEELREKRILYDPDAPIGEVTLSHKNQDVHVLADGNVHLINRGVAEQTSILKHRADTQARKEFFDALENLRCQSFWDEEPKVLSRDTVMKMRLIRTGGHARKETWVLEKVSTLNGEQWFLHGGPENLRFAVAKEALDVLLRDGVWLLDKRWTQTKAEDCGYLSFERSGASRTFVRQDGHWFAQGPHGWKADSNKVQDFLTDLLAMPVEKFIPSSEIAAQGGLRIHVGRSDKEQETVLVQRLDGQWTLHRQGDSFIFPIKRLAVPVPSLLDDATWRDRQIVDLPWQGLKWVAIKGPDGIVEFCEDNAESHGPWRLSKPRTGRAQQVLLQDLLSSLTPLRAERFLNARDAKSVGTFKARVRIQFATDPKDPLKTRELLIGQPVRDGYVAQLGGDACTFVLSKKVVAPMVVPSMLLIAMIEEDANQNGKVDEWIHYEKGRRAWMASDDDEDGTVDSKTFWCYNKKGELLRMDCDTNNDGYVDQRTFFKNAVPYRQEDDTRGKGGVDVWTSFVKGIQARQRLDQDGDGRPDMTKKLLRDKKGELIGARVHPTQVGSSDYLERYDGEKIVREPLQKAVRDLK